MNKTSIESEIEIKLQPESDLEFRMIAEPEFQNGLFWGKPRFGHPEGQVINHIFEVLENVDKLNTTPEIRQKLRIITYVHDTFKHLEHKGTPRDWSRHHGVYARKFLQRFTQDSTLLKITEFHDEAYYSWRLGALYRYPEKSRKRLNKLIQVMGEDIQLFYLFFKCDTKTGDKIQTPVRWFEEMVPSIERIYF